MKCLVLIIIVHQIVSATANVLTRSKTILKFPPKENDSVLGPQQDNVNIDEEFDEYEDEEDENDPGVYETKFTHTDARPCSVMVVSSNQQPLTQSIIRKYRYDTNGILIPSSVQYFLKLPLELSSPQVLVPLKDKAFDSVGGFIRYYKEIPPIPQFI